MQYIDKQSYLKFGLSSAPVKGMVRTANSRRRSVMLRWGNATDGVGYQPCNLPSIGRCSRCGRPGHSGAGALVTAAWRNPGVGAGHTRRRVPTSSPSWRPGAVRRENAGAPAPVIERRTSRLPVRTGVSADVAEFIGNGQAYAGRRHASRGDSGRRG